MEKVTPSTGENEAGTSSLRKMDSKHKAFLKMEEEPWFWKKRTGISSLLEDEKDDSQLS